MSNRFPLSRVAPLFALAMIVPLAAQTTPAPAAKHQTQNATPRTPDGHPDLQGVWTNATLTPMERPAAFAGKATATDDEAAKWEKAQADEVAAADGKADADFHRRAGSGETGGYNALFIDRGSELARVDGVKRTSLVIDPPEGKVPPITAEARARMAAGRRGGGATDSASMPCPMAHSPPTPRPTMARPATNIHGLDARPQTREPTE